MPASAQVDQTWSQLNADNSWNLTSMNWDAGAVWVQNNNALFVGAGEPVLVGPDPIIFNDMTFSVTGYTIGAGAGSLILANDRASAITVAGTGVATIAETMADSMNGASSLTKLGTGTLVLSGLNTYTGNTSINEGTLSVSVLNNSGTASNVGAGSTINIGAGATAGALTYTGTGEVTNRILDLAGSTGGATITQSGSSGTLKFTSDFTASGAGIKTLTLSGSTLGMGEIAGAIVNNSATNTTALTKTGTGTWVLSGNNTYSGATTLSGGVLWVNHANALGATTAGTTQSGASELRISGGITMAAEPISISGGGIGNAGALRNFADNNTYAGTLTLAAQSRIVADGGTLTMTGANAVTAATGTNQNLILSGAGNINIAGDITLGTGFISKDAFIGGGTGTLTLGGNNTYTGATTVGAGRLKLDYTTNNTSKLSDSAALVLGTVTGSVPGIGSLNTGGTVELAGGTHAEIVSGTTLTANTVASTITRSSGSAVLHLNFVTPNTGTGLVFTAPGIATTDNFPTNGILGFWARMNVGGVSSWATSGGIDDSPIVAFANYNDVNRLGGTIPNDAAGNIRIINGGTSGNITLGGVPLTQAYSLQMDATGPATVAMGATDVLNIGDDLGGGIWQTANAGSLTIGSTVGSGILTSGAFESGLPAANLQLINDSVTNNLVVNSLIANNGIDVVAVTKSGAGTVVLNADNTFTGPLTVAGGGTLILTGNNAARPTGVTGTTTVAGTLQVQANASNTSGGISTVLGSEQTANQPFLLNNGGTLQLRSDSPVTFAGGNNFGGLGSAVVTINVNQLTSAGTNSTLTFAPNGFNVSNTTINVTGGNGYRLALGNINNVTGANGNTMTLNPTTATLTVAGYTGTTAFTSSLNLSGTSSGNIVTGPVTNTTSATPAVISVAKLGSSTWELQGANTYTGTTLVREGTLTLSGNRTATAGGITVGDAAGLNATLNISNGNFGMGTFIVSSQANSSVVNQTGGSITMSGTQMIVGNAAVGSVGTYNLSGGTLTGPGSINRGVILGTNAGTTGVFNLSGTGNLALGTAALQVGRSDDGGATNSTGIFNQTGGTAAIGTLTIGGGTGTLNNARTSGTLNLTGGTFTATNFTLLAAANSSTANINIGGTSRVTLPAFPAARGLNAVANITFDGGTLIPAAASTSYMGGLTNAFVTANGAKFDVASARDITVSQALIDAAGQTGTLTKLGAGTLTLTGANSYTGATTVSAGTLLVDGSLAGGPVTVGAAGTFGGSATLAGTVTTASGSRIVPGGSTVAGTLTVGGLTLANGVAVEFDLGASSDLINVTNPGGLALNGGVFSIFNTGGLTPFSTNGTYPLIDYLGAFTGSLANINIGNAQAGKFYTVNNDAANTLITLTIGDATVTEWNTGSGVWTLATNWTAGIPNAPGAVAKFGAVPQSPTTVTADGAKTVGGIVFDNANSYTLTGGAADTITLSNGIATAGVTVNSGSHTIAAPVALATDTLISTAADTALRVSGNVSGAKTLTAAGLGTTTLTGTNSYGATVVSSGTLQIGDNGTTGTLGSGDVTVSGGATLAFNRSNDLTVANNIGGTTGQLTKLGAGILTLSGTNTFGTGGGGGLNLNAGTVKLGSASALPAGVRLNFAGGTLDLNENNLTVSSLSGSSGSITDNGLTAGTTTLTIDSSSASTFGGAIASGSARAVAVSKGGTGALTLVGNNTFTGGLTITSGAVIAAAPLGSTAIPGNVTLGNGTSPVFLINGLSENPNQFGAATALTFANTTLDAKFQLRGSVSTLAGIDSSPATTLSIIQNDEVGTPGYTSAPGLATLVLNTVTDHSFTGLIRNQNGGGLNIIKEGIGTQEIRNVAAAPHNFGTAEINAGKLTFNLSGVNNTLGAGTTVILGDNGTLGLDGTWNMNRLITGSGNVVKQGAATVTISSSNSYTGNTTVAEGTLIAAGVAGSNVIPANVVMGTGTASNIFLVMGAENQFAPTSAIRFDNGPGRNAKLELRGFNQTIAGLDSDANDTLSIVQNQETGTPAAATLTIDATTDHVFNGLIRTQAGGPLNLVKIGAGTQELRNIAAQGYNFGEATINAGKLVLNLDTLPGGVAGHNQLGANVSLIVNAGGTLGLDGTWNMNRSLSGTGDVVKQGAGTVTASSFLSHTGKTNIVGGTLLVTGSITGTSEVNVQNGGTLGGTGNLTPAAGVTGSINIFEGGELAPGLDLNSGFTIGSLFATLSGGVFDISLAVTPPNSQSLLFDIDATFGNDQVILAGGPLKIGTGVLGFDDFEFTSLTGFAVGTYKLFDGDTSIMGTLNAANLSGTLAPGFTGTIGFGDNNQDILLTVVPEPGSATLLLASAGSLLGLRRFRRRSV